MFSPGMAALHVAVDQTSITQTLVVSVPEVVVGEAPMCASTSEGVEAEAGLGTVAWVEEVVVSQDHPAGDVGPVPKTKRNLVRSFQSMTLRLQCGTPRRQVGHLKTKSSK